MEFLPDELVMEIASYCQGYNYLAQFVCSRLFNLFSSVTSFDKFMKVCFSEGDITILSKVMSKKGKVNVLTFQNVNFALSNK